MSKHKKKCKSKKEKCAVFPIVSFRTEFGFPPLAFKPFPHLGVDANRGALNFPPIGFVGQGRGHVDLNKPFPLAFGVDDYLLAGNNLRMRARRNSNYLDLLPQLQINVAYSPRQFQYPF